MFEVMEKLMEHIIYTLEKAINGASHNNYTVYQKFSKKYIDTGEAKKVTEHFEGKGFEISIFEKEDII